MEEIARLISQYGFPMVVAMYSLVRLETTIKENTRVMTIIASRLGVEPPEVKDFANLGK